MRDKLEDSPLIVLVALIIIGSAFVADVYVFPDLILPGPPFFIAILIAAYFLSPRTTAGIAVVATATKLAADLKQQTPSWLLILYGCALVLVGIAGVALASKMRHEAALANEMRRLKAEAEERAQEAQRRAAELDVSNKELQDFAYSVAHDLRAPLRHINSFSQLLLQEYLGALDARGQEYLQFLTSSSQKMGQLIDDLLKLSRVTRAEMHCQPINLSGMVRSVAAGLRKKQPDRQVELTIAPNVVANGDPQLMRTVFERLLENAWKFTSDRSEAKIEFGITHQNGMPVYHVTDNGVGFDMAYVGKLFGAFQRLHRAEEYPGTGIGLATVQRIIQRHGGRVWAEGVIGEGATIYFTLQ